jgi:hypothetical protein
VLNNDDLNNLIKQIDEIKDDFKDNDKVDWVFEETSEGQELNNILNEWLTKALESNLQITEKILNEIIRILDDPTLKLEQNIRNNLMWLSIILWWIIDNNSTEETENWNESLVDPDFVKNITFEDLKSIIYRENKTKKIKKQFIKEKDWKQYINIKWKSFVVWVRWVHGINQQKTENMIIPCSSHFYIWNADCITTIDKYKTKIEHWKITETLFTNWDAIKIDQSDKLQTWTANWINIKWEWPDNGYYHFYSNNNSKLDVSMFWAEQTILKITKILSIKQNNPEVKCSIENEADLKIWNEIFDFQWNKTKEIAGWLNNYYN